MDMHRIPFVGKLFSAPETTETETGEGDPAIYSAQEICIAIEQLIETWAAARAQNVDWQRRNIEDLHHQDNISAPFVAQLIEHYLALPPSNSSVSGRFLAAIRGYWEEMGELHLQCIVYLLRFPASRWGTMLPLLIQRALYHHAMQIKWLWLRYQVIPPYLWARLHKLYAVAEKHGFARLPLPLPGRAGADSSCEALYLRPQILHILRPDTLLPCEIEQADRWIARWNNSVFLEKTMAAEKHRYAVNLNSSAAPRPVVMLESAGDYRYWDIGLMLAAMQAGRDPGEEAQDAWVHALWRRIVNDWSGVPRGRRHPRHRIEKSTELFRGFGEIHAKAAQRLLMEQKTAYCRVRDASTEGFCLMLRTADSLQLTIHSLIGISSGRKLQVGMVCRMRRHESGWTEVGIRQLTAHAVPVKLESMHANIGGQMMDALYLSIPGRFRKRRCVLTSASIIQQGGQWRLLSKGKRFLIRLGAPLELTSDYILADFDSLTQPAKMPC